MGAEYNIRYSTRRWGENVKFLNFPFPESAKKELLKKARRGKRLNYTRPTKRAEPVEPTPVSTQKVELSSNIGESEE